MKILPTRLTEAADELLLIGPWSDAERDTFASAAALLREAAARLEELERRLVEVERGA